MPTRTGHARWEGQLEGKGTFELAGFKGTYTVGSRFQDEKGGTNPEELLGAAHASCFAMALSLDLDKAGFKSEYVDVTAHVTVRPKKEGGFRITQSHLECEAKVPGADQAAFLKIAEGAKVGCPVSQALAGTEITLEARLIT